MSERIPFLLFGDGPRVQSGLARIARDLAVRLHLEAEALGIAFAQVGIDYPTGWHFEAWPFYGFQPTMQDYGRIALIKACADLQRDTGQRPIVLTIQDPARIYDLIRRDKYWRSLPIGAETIDATFWSYFAVDAHNPQGKIGGPAAAAVQAVDRVLGYGKWGAQVLHATLGAAAPAVEYLPHGLDTRLFRPGAARVEADDTFIDWHDATRHRNPLIIGCVAANQPRKDFGLLFSVVAALQHRGHEVALWLHTDLLTGMAWDIGELATQFCLRKDQVFVSTDDTLSDQALAYRYTCSDVTIAPGLGEGFGYPIVESLACGTRVFHGNYAGGVELIPDPAYLIEPAAWRLESVYALARPVYDPQAWADAILAAPRVEPAVLAGSVAHLDWQHLWPRWRSWFTQGLQQYREAAT